MFTEFSQAGLTHISVEPSKGNASFSVLTADDFSNAISEIKQWNGYQPTPLYALKQLALDIGVAEIHYKDEGPRFNLGSFKALGGSYAAARVLQREISKLKGHEINLADIRNGTLAEDAAKITLVSATDGNHGRSLAWGAKMFGAPCRIYIHAEVSEGRAQAMRDLGANVIRVDGDYDFSVDEARNDAEANGWFVVSDTSWEGYTQPPTDVMSGYGVMVSEICETMATPPTHLLLQGGVGGLAAGVTAYVRQHWGDSGPRIIIVEPEYAACLYESAKKGSPVNVNISEETIMAGLSCGEPSELAWQILQAEAQDFITIPDSIVAPSMRLAGRPLGNDPAIVAGESAVAGLAALIAATQDQALKTKLGLNENSNVLLIGSEGATDPDIYNEIMAS